MTDLKNVRYMVFDLGGVVLEWNPEAIVQEVTDDLAQQQVLLQDVLLHADWLALDCGTITEVEAIERFAKRSNWSIEDMTNVMRIGDRSMKLKMDTLELMKDLKAHGYPLYCLSNMPVERYAYLRETHDIWDMFEGIVTSGHINMVKPAPEIYQHLLSTYSLEPVACMFLDDAPHNVKGAHAVGMQSLHFTTADKCRNDLSGLFKTS